MMNIIDDDYWRLYSVLSLLLQLNYTDYYSWLIIIYSIDQQILKTGVNFFMAISILYNDPRCHWARTSHLRCFVASTFQSFQSRKPRVLMPLVFLLIVKSKNPGKKNRLFFWDMAPFQAFVKMPGSSMGARFLLVLVEKLSRRYDFICLLSLHWTFLWWWAQNSGSSFGCPGSCALHLISRIKHVRLQFRLVFQ